MIELYNYVTDKINKRVRTVIFRKQNLPMC